jgi:hypothetical protein
MNINDDVIAIDNAITKYTRICKSIGEIDNRIQSCVSQLIVEPFNKNIEIRAEELRGYRARLEHDRARAEKAIYDTFEHYYS